MKFFSFHFKLYPLLAIISSIFIIVVGLVCAKNLLPSTIYLASLFLYLCLFGYYKEALKVLPIYILIASLFFLIFYLVSQEFTSGWAMNNRLASVFLAVILGIGTEPIKLTRSLSSLHAPKAIVLGMLIAMSFMPLLKQEIIRVKEAMRTRGASSIFNPKILYRAFLIPFITRLVNISDTLSLSVETRGFTLEKTAVTVYKEEKVTIIDIIFVIGLIIGTVLLFVL